MPRPKPRSLGPWIYLGKVLVWVKVWFWVMVWFWVLCINRRRECSSQDRWRSISVHWLASPFLNFSFILNSQIVAYLWLFLLVLYALTPCLIKFIKKKKRRKRLVIVQHKAVNFDLLCYKKFIWFAIKFAFKKPILIWCVKKFIWFAVNFAFKKRTNCLYTYEY